MSTSASFDAYAARHAAIAALEAELLPGNKAVLLAALTRASIISVMTTFDGSGDSGQIEQIDAFGVGDAIVPLPETAIVFKEIMSEDLAIVSRTRSIREAIEIMAYDLLEKTHDGWDFVRHDSDAAARTSGRSACVRMRDLLCWSIGYSRG